MIAQRHRFHGRNSLKPLFSKGRTVKTDFFTLRHAANKRRDSYRLAIVVAKKVDKRAVARNRIRRRLYELFRLNLAPTSSGVDLAIIVLTSELAIMDYEQLQTVFRPALADLAKHYGTDVLI